MSQTYAKDGQGRTIAGGAILLASSALAAVLVVAGLLYAAGTGPRHQAALAAAGCEPGLAPSGLPCTTAAMLARQYETIMITDSQQLNADMAAYAVNERHDLAAAEAALTADVTAQNALDASLAAITFPPAIAPIAAALIRAGQARAQLIAEQAHSSTLSQLRSFNDRVQLASAAIQAQLQLMLKALDSPPQAG